MSSEQDFKIKYLSYKMKYLKLKQLDNEANGGGVLGTLVKTVAKNAAKNVASEAKGVANEAAKDVSNEAAKIAKAAVEKKLSPQTPRIPPTPPPSPTNIKYDSNNINEVREQLDHANRKIAEYQVLLNSRE